MIKIKAYLNIYIHMYETKLLCDTKARKEIWTTIKGFDRSNKRISEIIKLYRTVKRTSYKNKIKTSKRQKGCYFKYRQCC